MGYRSSCALVVLLAPACLGFGWGWSETDERPLRPISSKWHGSTTLPYQETGMDASSDDPEPPTLEFTKTFLADQLHEMHPESDKESRDAFVERIYAYDPNPAWHGVDEIRHSEHGEGPPSGEDTAEKKAAAEDSYKAETKKFLQNHINREASPNTRGWVPWARSFWSKAEPLGGMKPKP